MYDELVLFRENKDNDVEFKGNEFFRIISASPNKILLGIMVLLAIASGVLPIFSYILLGDVTTSLTEGSDFMKNISNLCLKFFYVILAIFASTVLTYVFRTLCNPMWKYNIRMKLFESIISQPLSFFDSTSTGILISRLSEDITLIQNTFFDNLLQFIISVAGLIGSIVIAFIINWKITLVSLVACPVIIIAFYISNCFVSKLWNPFNEKSTNSAARAEEVITQFRTVKSFDCEEKEYTVYRDGINTAHSIYNKASLIHATKNAIILAIIYLVLSGIAYYGAYIIVNKKGDLDVGKYTIIITDLIFVAMSFSQISSYIDEYKKARISAAKVLDLIDRKPETNILEGGSLEGLKGKIEFQDVGFKYASRDEWAIRHLSFIIQPGETVAFVGESGCGKTTALSLIQKLYEIQEGKILIDDVDISTLSQNYIRSQIAVVPQTPVLFSMSVADNIRFARTEATEEMVSNAAVIGNADSFIKDLKEGYNTEVEQNSLSGGQKQRICISRAVLAKTPIMLLDEATAALDTESEQKVQESIDNFRKEKTAIIVAHRLATVINADRILVFKEGKIVETGTHSELLEKGGEYANLIKFQLQ